MAEAFKEAMLKLSILGHKQSDLIDCSDVIPIPKPLGNNKPHLPAGSKMSDIEQAVSSFRRNTIIKTSYMSCSALLLPSQPSLPTQARPLPSLLCKLTDIAFPEYILSIFFFSVPSKLRRKETRL